MDFCIYNLVHFDHIRNDADDDEQKDRKSGIQGFECNVDPFEKNTFHFWEIYESFTTMNDVRASPEHTQFVVDVSALSSTSAGAFLMLSFLIRIVPTLAATQKEVFAFG